jgi:hypothetical protein
VLEVAQIARDDRFGTAGDAFTPPPPPAA